ncbi:MAG: NADH-quinone oxidoreductase subunit A [Pseudomonadota bacterium]
MLEQYLPILVFIIVGLGFGCLLPVVSYVVSPKKPDDSKLSAFECGFSAFDEARSKFDIRFYLIAILFIIFDLEIAFLYPWAVSFEDMPLAGMISMGFFLLELIFGFIYVWQKGALEWE